MCVHLLPAACPGAGRPTLTWIFFPGNSPALFALLTGTGLAFTSGGRRPVRGRAMTATQVGVEVRAVLLPLGLSIGHRIPPEPRPAPS